MAGFCKYGDEPLGSGATEFYICLCLYIPPGFEPDSPVIRAKFQCQVEC
jgi:hypothetical protein